MPHLLVVGSLLAALISSTVSPAAAADAAAEPGEPAAEHAADGSGVRPEEGQIERLYRAVFARPPDPAGFEYWARLRTSGTGLEAVAEAFTASEEYRLRFVTDSDDDFVDRLYRNVLGRPPDEPGARYWVGILDAGVGRIDVLLLFSESPEFELVTGTSLIELPSFEVGRTRPTEESLGSTWRAGCPVPVSSLVELTVPHVDFAGEVVLGTIVVRDRAVGDVVDLFRTMYLARMPIEVMRPASEFGGDDDALMAANVTSGFNCRTIAGSQRWSRHAYGEAVDVNPRYNPEVVGDTVRPPEGRPWADRDRYHPAMLRAGDPLIARADALGWTWGGRWVSLSDPQHLEMPR